MPNEAPSITSLPALACGTTPGMVPKASTVSPESTEATAGTVPLYGTCTRSMPAICLSRSIARCVIAPLPEEPYDILPGLALRTLMKSRQGARVQAGRVTSTIGEPAIIAIGSKSFSTS